MGKSSIAQQTAATTNRKPKDTRLSQFDAVDLRGIPKDRNDKTVWLTPDEFPTSADGPVLWIFDEINRAPVSVQNAAMQLILDRKLGSYILPDTCEIIACCNRESDGGGIQKMPQALCNRFIHVHMVVDVDDWCKWAVRSNIEPATVAFIRWKPELLHQFSLKDRAFPTPRSWEFVSSITAQHPGNGIEHALFAGAVGEGAAVEYSAFMRLFRSLPNIDAILLNPQQAAVPKELSTLFAVSAALARRASLQNFGRVIQYLDRLPSEYGVYAVQDAIRRDSSLQATPEFATWAVNHSDVLF